MATNHPPHVCKLLKVFLSKHRHGGSPLPKDVVISFVAVAPDELGEAKDTFDTIRKSREYPFVMNMGPKHALLDNGEFPALVDFLYYHCEWDKFKINNMIRHYDVYTDHTFDE